MANLGKIENTGSHNVWKLETEFSDRLSEDDKFKALSETVGITLI